MMTDNVIVTHQNPDVDAIGSIWLLKKFDKEKYRNAKVVFAPAGDRLTASQLQEHGVNESDVTYVDTGGGEFDHHDEEGVETCASKIILDYLVIKYPDLVKDEALRRVVEFINGTDHFEAYFWPEPNSDRYVFGIEQILNGYKLGGHGDDNRLVSLGMDCLDGAFSMMTILVEAETELKTGREFEWKGGKGLLIESSNDAVMKLAQKNGYTLVVRKDPGVGNMRIKAAPLPEIDLTPLYEKVASADSQGSWYFHPGKHMILNGSGKREGQKPTPLTLDDILKMIESQKD